MWSKFPEHLKCREVTEASYSDQKTVGPSLVHHIYETAFPDEISTEEI
jgi:hypothetical protein